MLILDEFGDTIRADVFFYPVCKRFSSFQELCEDIKAGNININKDTILIWFGHGQIFRFGARSISIELKKLLAAIWARNKEAIIFISTLVPTPPRISFTAPSMIKFNKQLKQLVEGWKDSGKRVRILDAQQVFTTQITKLDERTGYVVETLEFNEKTQKDFIKSTGCHQLDGSSSENFG